MSSLRRTLGGALPASVADLDEDVQERLAAQVREASERQDAEIDRAVRIALKGVPLPLRRLIRKALLG